MNQPRKTGLAAMLEGKTAALDEKLNNSNQPTRQLERFVTMPGQLGAFRLQAQEWQKRIDELEEALRKAKEQGGALEINLDALTIVPGRQRKLSPEQYAELKENLRQHKLITPISVRVVPDGTYEVVSGHNRVQIYRELGRTSIKAWLADEDPDKTDELAFYANLLHPDLSAYEKYVGLKKIMEHNPSVTTHEALAQRTGLSRTAVTELLSFDHLPLPARLALEAKPSAVGIKTALKLSTLAQQGKGDQVTEAIQKAVETGIDQQEILRFAESKAVVVESTEKPKPVTLKAGRRNYCSILGARKTLRLDFSSEAERIEAELLVKDILQKLAEQKKEAK